MYKINIKIYLVIFLLIVSFLTILNSNQSSVQNKVLSIDNNTSVTTQTQQKVYDMGRLINFEINAPLNAYSSYIKFSAGFTRWNTISNPSYPPHSGNYVAYTWELNNSIQFSFPQRYIGAYFTVGGSGWEELTLTGYDWLGQNVSSMIIPSGVKNYYASVQYSGITKIGVTGNFNGWNTAWAFDDIYSENATSLYRTIGFENNTNFNYASYIHFSPDYVRWNSSGYSTYPAHTGDYVAYASTTNNYVNFSVPQYYVGAYFDVAGTGSGELFFVGYDSYNQVILNATILEGSKNQYAYLIYQGISSVKISGNFNNWQLAWTMDDLISINATVSARLMTFDQ